MPTQPCRQRGELCFRLLAVILLTVWAGPAAQAEPPAQPRKPPAQLAQFPGGVCLEVPGRPDMVCDSKLMPEPIERPRAAIPGVDLGIGDDRLYGRPVSWSQRAPLPREGMLATIVESRPGVFIAWRNTNLVEEVEVRVRNRGTQEGRGRVFVDILDEEGKLLLHLEPPPESAIVTVPPKDRGGEEGKIVKMMADRRLNRLIDLYDRTRTRYDVMAVVQTLDVRDANPADNAKVKAYNIPFRAVPGFRHTLNNVFANFSDKSREVRWKLESTKMPDGWQLSGSALVRHPFSFEPGEKLNVFLTMDIPMTVPEGALVELRLSLLDAHTHEVLQQHEWFLVHDTQPPFITNVKVAPQDTGHIQMEEMVSDPGSGVLEASGVWSEYSTDDGRTFSQRTHNYTVGNFVDPTTFQTSIGPFRSGTQVMLFLNASDTAGNVQRIGPQTVVVP
jgi:hypothetical protein